MDNSKDRSRLLSLPGFALRRAANVMMSELAGRLSVLDLRISDASVLLLVGERDDLSSAEIGKELDIQRANMVPVLNRLEAAGLIERVPIDRKSQAIVLTPAGREMLLKVRDLTDKFEDELLARIPEKHRGHFLPALHALFAERA